MKKKIYVGCSLTHAPEEFKNQVSELKELLKEKYEILDFIGLVNGTERDVYLWDTNCVKTCDLFLAICDLPSIGLGMEIGIAIENKKTTIACAHRESKVSRMVLGVDVPEYKFLKYDKLNELIKYIDEELLLVNE